MIDISSQDSFFIPFSFSPKSFFNWNCYRSGCLVMQEKGGSEQAETIKKQHDFPVSALNSTGGAQSIKTEEH